MKYFAILCILLGIWCGTKLGRWEERKEEAAAVPPVIGALVVYGCSTYAGTVFTLKDGSQVGFDPTEKSLQELSGAVDALADQGHAAVIHTPCASDESDGPADHNTASF